VKLDTWIGEVAAVDAEKLPGSLARYDCRNNRLAQLGLETDGFADEVARSGRPLRQEPRRCLPRHQHRRHPADRAGLSPARSGDRRAARRFHLPHDPQLVLAGRIRPRVFRLEGPAMVISTACSSSAKVFAAAARQLGLRQPSTRRSSAASIRCA
jgi:3-oxoacyl-[acyl-carrier-protein] synthase-1